MCHRAREESPASHDVLSDCSEEDLEMENVGNACRCAPEQEHTSRGSSRYSCPIPGYSVLVTFALSFLSPNRVFQWRQTEKYKLKGEIHGFGLPTLHPKHQGFFFFFKGKAEDERTVPLPSKSSESLIPGWKYLSALAVHQALFYVAQVC